MLLCNVFVILVHASHMGQTCAYLWTGGLSCTDLRLIGGGDGVDGGVVTFYKART